MKAGDGSAGQTSSRERWLSTPLSDPNAALWASITPPANPTLATVIRRRAAAWSLDPLAQRLHRRLPHHFSTRAMARRAILGVAAAFGAAVGAVVYLGAGPAPLQSAPHLAAEAARAAPTTAPARSARGGDEAPAPEPGPTRTGVTQLATAGASPAPTLTPTASRDEPEQITQHLRPSANADAAATKHRASKPIAKHRASKPKAKRRASKLKAKRRALEQRKSKAAARRAAKARRARRAHAARE